MANNGDPVVRGGVSLKNVLDQSPAESDTEARLFESTFDRDVESGVGLSAGIFSGVPNDENHVSQKTDYDATKEVTVEEEMFNLTRELEDEKWKPLEAKSTGQETPTTNTTSVDAHLFGRRAEKVLESAKRRFKKTDSLSDFKSFYALREDSMLRYCKFAILFCIIPATAVAALLFYALGNPGGDRLDNATASWWVLFLFARQVIMISLAKATEAVVIDFLTPVFVRVVGSYITLIMVKSKGWPFQISSFAVYNFAMLYGGGRFANHWLFYQDAIDLFNAKNSAGDVTSSRLYRNILIFLVAIGPVVSLKRFLVAVRYGQGVYERYGKDLARIVKRGVLIAKLAQYANENQGNNKKSAHVDVDIEKIEEEESESEDDEVSGPGTPTSWLVNTRKRDLTGSLARNEQFKIQELLGEWEEPETQEQKLGGASISAIVQFRTVLLCLDVNYPFSPAFGRADKRESCVECSQRLYQKLVECTDSTILKFDDIAMLARKEDGTLNVRSVRELIRLLRPTRDGELTLLDFVKSIDTVYKNLRTLYSSVANTQRMDAAFQRLFNVMFYFILVCIGLAVVGVDPVTLFGSLAAFIVGFAFMIGGASSKYFEGLLLVLVRKPYDIGDLISVSNVNNDVSWSGSSGWLVKDVDLFKTTVMFGTTGEVATYANGSLASSRIINHNRSPKALLGFYVKFGIEVPPEKIETFAKEVEQYVKDRPREWLAFSCFRLTAVEANLGYVEYKVGMQHRESWQQIGALLNSKAGVQLFARELSQRLGMRYEQPPMPIHLDMVSSREKTEGEIERLLQRSPSRESDTT